MKHKPWTPEELAALRHLYLDWSASAVGKVLGRKPGSVHQKAAALGLKKSASFYASDASGRIQRAQQNPVMASTRFKPGQEPWNKGVPGSTGLHPNCARNHFKQGRAPQEARNYLPIGSLRMNHDGHLERKTTDDPALVPARRWVPVYRLVWEAAHGPIPAGHMVVFKPGQKTAVLEQITTDRLEQISRAENVRRNHPKNKHPELARLVQLKGAITRQVNRINKEAQERTQA